MCEAASGSIDLVGLPLSRNVPPTMPVRLADERVAQPGLAVELVDRHVHERVAPAGRTWSRGASSGPWRRPRSTRPSSDADRSARTPRPSPGTAARRIRVWPRPPIRATFVRYRPTYRPIATQTIAAAITMPATRLPDALISLRHSLGAVLYSGPAAAEPTDDGDVIVASFTGHLPRDIVSTAVGVERANAHIDRRG